MIVWKSKYVEALAKIEALENQKRVSEKTIRALEFKLKAFQNKESK